MRINLCWQFMGSDRAREWTGSCLGGVRVRGSKKFSWLVHHHGLASHSYLICQTVYMGSGLPTRKSVLNHSMTSNFCLLYKHKLKHKRAFCRRLRWRGGTELRGNFVLTQFTNRGGLSSAVGIRSPTYRFASQVSLSDLPLMFTHCASTLSLVNHLLLIWGGQVHAFLVESECIGHLVFSIRVWHCSGWEATFLVGKPSLSSLTCGTCNGKRSIVEYQIFDR